MAVRLYAGVVVATTLLAFTPALARAHRAHPHGTLTAVVPDEPTAAATRAALAPRLARTGTILRVVVRPDTGGRTTPAGDLVLLDDVALAGDCTAGRLRVLDRDGICGVSGPVQRLALGWDESHDGAPPNWSALWDLARLPGRRGLPRRAEGALEIALMADGTAPADIYGALGSKPGADQAFRKLDQLRPYILWWADGRDALQALGSGAVRMSATPAPANGSARHSGHAIGLQWQDDLVEGRSWAIPAAAHAREAALRAIEVLREKTVATEIAASLPQPPVGTDELRIDDAFWAAHPALQARFDAWLGP